MKHKVDFFWCEAAKQPEEPLTLTKDNTTKIKTLDFHRIFRC